MPRARSPLEPAREGLRVKLRVQPGASRDRIDGPTTLDDGTVVLKVRVTAVAEGGKANAAVVKLLAKAWKLPKGAIRVITGHKERRKTLLVAGDPEDLTARLGAWVETLEPGTA